MEIGALLRADLAQSTARFLAHDRALDAAISPEALHDARVELRRIRSSLRTFRSLFDSEWLRSALAQISWYQTQLGDVRDTDVAIGRLLRLEACIADPAGSAALTALLVVERATAMRILAIGRASARHAAATRHLEELASDPPMRRRAGSDALALLAPVLDQAWKNLRAASRAARREPTELALHSVRLRAKELRYASEIASPVLGEDALVLARACARVQRRLGRHRDAVAAVRWLQGASAAMPAAAGLATTLADGQRELAERMEASWRGDMQRAKAAWRTLYRGQLR